MTNPIPLVIEFAPGSRVERETEAARAFGQGDEEFALPETYVVLNEQRIAIPSDQVIMDDASGGAARVGFGGMSFEGVDQDRLVFFRVREMLPEEKLPVDRADVMAFEPGMVTRVMIDGNQVWPRVGSA